MSAKGCAGDLEARAAATASRLVSQHGDGATEILSHLMRAARADLNRDELDHLTLVFRHLTRAGLTSPAPVADSAGASSERSAPLR